jgi:PAS domain-containing protein
LETAFFNRFFRDLREFSSQGDLMIFNGWFISAGAWLAPATAVALFGLAATIILLRDHFRLAAHARALEEELAAARQDASRAFDEGRLYRTLVEALPDLLVARDGAGRITFANASVAALARRHRDCLIGSSGLPRPTAVIRPEEGSRDGGTLEECFEGAGGEHWIRWVELPLADGTLRIGRDITAERRERRRRDAPLPHPQGKAQPHGQGKPGAKILPRPHRKRLAGRFLRKGASSSP